MCGAFMCFLVQYKDSEGWNAIIYAARNGHAECVEELLTRRRDAINITSKVCIVVVVEVRVCVLLLCVLCWCYRHSH